MRVKVRVARVKGATHRFTSVWQGWRLKLDQQAAWAKQCQQKLEETKAMWAIQAGSPSAGVDNSQAGE
jgi:hypothetical protein